MDEVTKEAEIVSEEEVETAPLDELLDINAEEDVLPEATAEDVVATEE